MKLFEYLDTVYVNTTLDLQKDPYTTYAHAKSLATQDLIHGQRKFFKWVNYFGLVFGYLISNVTRKFPKRYTQDQIKTWQDERKKLSDEKAKGNQIRVVPKA